MQNIKSLDDLVLDLQHHGRDSAAYAAFRAAAERTARSGGPGETFLDVLVSLCQAAPPA